MKIIIANPYFPPYAPGGAEHSLEQLCNSFALQGWGVEVVAVSLDGRAGREDRDGFVVHWLPAPERVSPGQDIPDIPYLRAPKYIADVRAVFQGLPHKPDVLIANNAQSYAAAAALARESGIPAVGIVRDTQMLCESGSCMDNMPARQAIPCSGYVGAGRCMIRFHRVRGETNVRPWPAWLWQGMQQHRRRLGVRNAVQGFVHLVTISDSLNMLVRRSLPTYPAGSITTISNLPTKVESARPEDVSAFMVSRGLSTGRYFLFAGRKTYGKGADLAVQAISSVRQRRTDLQLLLAGRGRVDEKSYAGVVDEPSVSQSMLMALLENSLALVIPGRWQEGLHRTMIDALRLGLPVICTEAGAPAVDGVVHQDNGLVVPCADPATLGMAMLEVSGWDQTRLSMCRNRGQAIFQERFSEDTVMDKWAELLGQVLHKRSTGYGTA